MRKILAVNMHDELSLSFILTFSIRLGIPVYFADASWMGWFQGCSFPSGNHFTSMCSRVEGKWGLISQEEFFDSKDDWLFLCCNPAWQSHVRDLQSRKPGLKAIGQVGNDNWTMDATLVPNMLCSVSDAFHATFQHNKVLYYPECDDEVFYYTPLKTEDRYKVRQYVNHFEQGMHELSNRGICNVCKAQYTSPGIIDLPSYWKYNEVVSKQYYPESQWSIHGLKGKDGQATSQETHKLGHWIRESSLTIHWKTFEGYGMNCIHSLMCGRPILMDSIWLRTRTISRFIIPYETGMFCDTRNQNDAMDFVRWYFSEFEVQQEICARTRKVFDSIVNWEEQAERVRKVIDRAS